MQLQAHTEEVWTDWMLENSTSEQNQNPPLSSISPKQMYKL